MAAAERREVNILLLGKSGVGKSTFINAFANYIHYEKLEEVKEEDEIHIEIPCTFVMYDEEGTEKAFEYGREKNRDGNESMKATESGTRGCKTYRFEFEALCINLIDTPGIGDTQGIDQDKANLEEILSYLSSYNSLHGVCVVLKPNEERLDTVLRYCILELLGQLDISAAKNIVYVFTNARSTLYRLGASGSAIKELLNDINEKNPGANITFTPDNYFCLDSEAFRFLIAKNKIEFNEIEKLMFSQSWTKSRNECVRMIKHIATLPEHNVQSTLSVNKARKLISVLSQPLGDILHDISINQDVLNETIYEVANGKGDLSKLKGKLFKPRTTLDFDYYDYPRFLCTSKKCINVVSGQGEEKIHYRLCYEMDESYMQLQAAVPQIGVASGAAATVLSFIPEITSLGGAMAAAATTVSTPMLLAAGTTAAVAASAAYYYFRTSGCSKCGCPFNDHMMRWYQTRVVEENVLDEAIKEQMDSRENDVQVYEAVMVQLNHEIGTLNAEFKLIKKATTTFAVFLKCRAITAYNDAFEDYLDILIEEAKTKGGSGEDRAKLILKLEEHKLQHQKEKEAYHNAMKDGKIENITPEDIDKLVDRLCTLEKYGPLLKKAIGRHMSMEERIRDSRTAICEVPTKKSFRGVGGLEDLLERLVVG